MRILVVSDSHGDYLSLREAIEMQQNASVLIHLGDGERDLEKCMMLCKGMRIVRVRGNCDFASDAPPYELVTVGGKNIYCTHGFAERVKSGDYELLYRARGFGAHIVLYGHTHTPVNRYEDGLYIFNPGSVADGNYGIVDITPSGTVCVDMKL
ncbi:MAG: metallophosphoesterase [Clostridiales bacterium]|nr:metallophosphoesterase [Clostridiales bacterium]